MSSQIAFVGLGHMGGPMAANLVDAGYSVTGFDLVPAAMDAARAAGVTIADTGAEAVAGADVVITMMRAGDDVLTAYQGPDGLLAAAKPNTLFLECSTIAVEDSRRAHALTEAAGHRGLDAPVSGGVVGAESGTLTFMVGGGDAEFADASELLDILGARIVHCGGPGAGQAAKVCNNMILGVSMIAVSEAFVLGEELGLSDQAIFDVAAHATGQCWAISTNCPVPGPVPASPANRDFEAGFTGALMAKDLSLAVRALESTGVNGRLGAMAEQIYRQHAAGDGAGQDFSSIIEDIRAGTGHTTTEGTA